MPSDSNIDRFSEQMPNDVIEILNDRSRLFDNLQGEVEILKSNLEHILQPFWQEIKNEMFDLKNQIKDKDAKIEQLEVANQILTKNLENVQNNLKMTKETYENVWQNQSKCLNSLRLTFGSLLWKASKEPNVVHYFTTGEKFSELLEIVNNSLNNFFDVSADKLLDQRCEMKKFMVSFIGIISNIAANVEGRSILVNTEKGQNLIKELLNKLHRIPIDEIPLQRIFLITFYNISINTVGLSLIENDFPLIKRIVNNILANNELKQISLKLLESVTYETYNQNLINFLDIIIPLQELKGNTDNVSMKLYKLLISTRKNMEYNEVVIN